MKLKKLTPEEEKVIVYKDTEPPFSGEYDKFFNEGAYVCRRCGTPLYVSKSKFDSGCGWPSFDEEIPGRVKRVIDRDGKRTEIVCAACDAHLGHVFEGEGLTSKNIRHCVNSVSLKFIPAKEKRKTEVVVFGGGCFWCVEAVFSGLKGVVKVASGYADGKMPNPIYEEVSGGKTGHAEVVKVEYDPDIISFSDLLEVFFAAHDPTTLNRQGNDVGTRYRSIILYQNEQQKKIAEEFIKKLSDEKVFTSPIVTEIKPLDAFYEAEKYHEHYYEKNTDAPYCQAVISPKLEKLKKKFGYLLK